ELRPDASLDSLGPYKAHNSASLPAGILVRSLEKGRYQSRDRSYRVAIMWPPYRDLKACFTRLEKYCRQSPTTLCACLYRHSSTGITKTGITNSCNSKRVGRPPQPQSLRP